jgi:hypothetical protein
MKMGLVENRGAGYGLIVGTWERLLKIEHMESTHEESHGLRGSIALCPA